MKIVLLIALMIFSAGLLAHYNPMWAMVLIVIFMGVIVLFMGKD